MRANIAIAVAAALPMVMAGIIRVPRDEPVPQATDAVVCPTVDEEKLPSPHVLYNLKKPNLSEWVGQEDKMPFFKKYDPELLIKFVDDFCEGKVKRDMGPCCQCDDDEDDCKFICVDVKQCEIICEMVYDSAETDATKDGEKSEAPNDGEKTDATKEAKTTDATKKTDVTKKTDAAKKTDAPKVGEKTDATKEAKTTDATKEGEKADATKETGAISESATKETGAVSKTAAQATGIASQAATQATSIASQAAAQETGVASQAATAATQATGAPSQAAATQVTGAPSQAAATQATGAPSQAAAQETGAPSQAAATQATGAASQAAAAQATGVVSETDIENKTCDTSKYPSYQSEIKVAGFTAQDIIKAIEDRWAKLQKPKNDKRGVPITADDVLRWSQGEGEDYQAKRPELFKNIAAETQAKRDETPKKKGGVAISAEDVLRWSQGQGKDYDAKRPELFKNIAAETQGKRDETSGKKGGVRITVDDVMRWAKGNDKAYRTKRPELFKSIADVLPSAKRSAEVDGQPEDNSNEAKLGQTFQSVLDRSKAALESVEKAHPNQDDKVKIALASLVAKLGPLSPGMDKPDALVADIVEANSESHEKRGELADVKLDIPSLIKIFEELWQAVQEAKEELHRLHEAGSQHANATTPASQGVNATTSASELEVVIAHCEPIVNNLNDLADIFDAIVNELGVKDEKKPVTHVEPDSVAATADDLVRRDDWSNNPMFSVKSSPNRENHHRIAQGNAEKILKDPHLHQ